MAKQDSYIKTAFRLPRELHAELLASAEKRGRSMNAEIIDRLLAWDGARDGYRVAVDSALAEVGLDDYQAGSEEYKKALNDVIRIITTLLRNQDRTEKDISRTLIEILDIVAGLEN
jgi:hypothetical protein